MRKNEIIEGKDYARTSSRDIWTGYAYISKVRVVANEVYHTATRSSVPRDVYFNDEGYCEAHLAHALTVAYPHDSTPRESSQALDALRTAKAAAERAWFAADENRMYIKGEYFGQGGVKCRSYVKGDDGVLRLGRDILVPRRELKMEWDEYTAERTQRAEARELSRRRAAVAEEERKAQRAVLKALVTSTFEGLGMSVPYVSDYGRTLELDHEHAIALLQAAARATEAVTV